MSKSTMVFAGLVIALFVVTICLTGRFTSEHAGGEIGDMDASDSAPEQSNAKSTRRPMSNLLTNRDLYLAIEDLSEAQADNGRTLEIYLLALLGTSSSMSNREALTLDEFFDLISSAFSADPLEFDDSWRNQYNSLPADEGGYDGWRATLIRQIVDLREMDAAGTLANEYRFFGVTAPRESRWFNFDPAGYLECAAAGALGGWAPGDDTGREMVPGPVAVLAEDGSIKSVNPEDLVSPTVEVPYVSWELFRDFIFCGQIYE